MTFESNNLIRTTLGNSNLLHVGEGKRGTELLLHETDIDILRQEEDRRKKIGNYVLIDLDGPTFWPFHLAVLDGLERVK